MPDLFDEFGITPQPAKPAPRGDLFDEFGIAPSKPANAKPAGSRSWGDVAGDATAALAGGGNQILQTLNWVADKATGPIADDWFAGNAKGLIADRQAIQDFKSPHQRYAEAQVSNAKGGQGVIDALLHNPSAAANFVGEQLPMFGVVGGGMRLARGAQAGANAVARMTAANVGTGTVLGAGDAATGAQADAWAAGQSDDVAREAGNRAAMVAAPISAVASMFGAGAESRVAGKLLGDQAAKLSAGQAAMRTIGMAGKEVGEEALDEGGTQFAQNYGAQSTYNPSQNLWEGVPEAATLGGALGLGMGGTLNAVEAVQDYRHPAPQPQVPPQQAAEEYAAALNNITRNAPPASETVAPQGETVTPESTAVVVPARSGEYIPASEPVQERGAEPAVQPLNTGGVWEAGADGVRAQPAAEPVQQATPQIEDKSGVLYAGPAGVSESMTEAAQPPSKAEIGKQQAIQKNALAAMRSIEAKHGDVVAKMPAAAKAQYTKAQNAYLAASEQLQQMGVVDPSIAPQQGVSSPRMNLRDDQLAGQIADTRERAAMMRQPFTLEATPAQSEDTPEGYRSTGYESNKLNKDTLSKDAQQSAALSTGPIQAEVQVDTRVRDDRSAGDQAITSPAADQPARSQPDQNGNEPRANASATNAGSEPAIRAGVSDADTAADPKPPLNSEPAPAVKPKAKTLAGIYDGDPVYHDGLGNVYRTIEHRGKQIKDYLTDQERAEILPVDSDGGQIKQSTKPAYQSGLSAARLQEAVDKAMVGVNNATVRVVQTAEEAAQIAKESAESIQSGMVEGFYQPKTGEIILIADSIDTPGRGVWVLAHELLHRGIEGHLGRTLFQVLHQAETNPFIQRLAKAIARDRGLGSDLFDRLLSVEEALAELNAAKETGNYASLLLRYRVNVPFNMREGLAAKVGELLDRFKAWMARFTGQPKNEFTNQQVLDLLGGAMDWVRGQAETSEAAQQAKLSVAPERNGEKPRHFGLGRDRAGGLTVGVTDAGYEAFATAVGALMDKTLGRGVGKVSAMSPELRKQLRQFKLDQAKAERTAQSVAEAGKGITLDDAKLLSDFIEGELQSGVVPPEHIKQMATAMRAALAQQGQDLVELGMLSQETVDRLGENYLPRLYTRQAKKLKEYLPEVLRRGVDGGRMKMRGKKMMVPADQVESYKALGWRKVADAKGGNVVMNRDWTREERAQMGEDRDARTRFVLGYRKRSAI